MNVQQIQQRLEDYDYWDARLIKLQSDYFGDEVTMVFEDTDDANIQVVFLDCSKVSFISSLEDREHPVKELTRSQIPYFLQDIELNDLKVDGKDLIDCKITAPPLDIQICCKSISITKQKL